MVTDMTKLYILIPVSTTLTFTQRHRVTRQNLCSHSVVKWHEVAQTYALVASVRGMPSKTFKNDEYGSFEHLLFLLVYSITVFACNLMQLRPSMGEG